MFTRRRVAVFIDGCYWHGCPEHHRRPHANAGYWTAKIARNIERDREADLSLNQAGWIALRVWEHEAPDEAAQRIANVVRARQ